MSRAPRILISAGEASGDRLGAALARAIRSLRPEAELVGMGGDEMAQAGVRLVRHASEVAVMGLVEVVEHLPAVIDALGRMQAAVELERPDLLVPVDFPDFNLRLAAHARAAGVPVVYYVSPQIWAWRRGRVRRIRDLVRRMLVLFPFETAFYEAAGVPVTFVGHPAADRPTTPTPRADVLRAAGLDPTATTVALLPGSRRGEVTRLLPVLLGAARLLARGRPGLQFVVPRARTLPAGWLERQVAGSGPARLHVVGGPYPEILEAADAGVVASGTASLDAAIAGLPAAVVYRMQPLSYALARHLVRVDHIALPNLVAGRRILPELVQDACRPDGVATAVGAFLDDPGLASSTREALGEVRRRLGGPGAPERAARAVLAELG